MPTVVEGVFKAWRKRGRAATGWPFLSWIGSLRPDPLKRLRLELPAGTAHDAAAGPDGVTCLEAHRPAGSLAGSAHRAAGSW